MRSTIRVRTGFTLIEMLVVISLIVLLVAMLMPSLSEARKSSLRTTCLSDRRQLNISSFMYGNDFNDCVPSNTSYNNWVLSGDRTPSPTMTWGNNSAHMAFETPGSITSIYPLGSLIIRQYIASPKILYCNEFPRNSLSAVIGWTGFKTAIDYPQYASTWGALTDGDANLGVGQIATAVAHYLFVNQTGTTTVSGLRFSQIADNWPINNTYGQKFTPFTYSCAYLNWGGYYMTGHDGNWMSTVFIDGSGRNINMAVMKKKYSGTLGTAPVNQGAPTWSNMQVWARQKNADTRPGGT